jgi:hypothetical protein
LLKIDATPEARIRKAVLQDGGRDKLGRMSSSRAPEAMPNQAPERPVSDALARLRRGEGTLDEYLDAQVEVAMQHLTGRMPEERLDVVREVLRDSLRTDPEFAEHIRKLTGRSVEPE